MARKQPACHACNGTGKTTADRGWVWDISPDTAPETLVWCPFCEKGRNTNEAFKRAFKVTRPG